MKRRLASTILACLALCGCAGGTSKVVALGSALTPVDALAAGAAAVVYYRMANTPAWSAKAVDEGADEVYIELSKSNLAPGGDGAASMAFGDAARRWCKERGSKEPPETLEFVEYWESTLVGATRKARGRARCVR